MIRSTMLGDGGPGGRLLGKIARSLARDRDLPLGKRLGKGVQYLGATMSAPLFLRACDRVGARARTVGAPIIDNQGRIEIGDDANLTSRFARVQLTAAPGGRLTIGNGVAVNFGTAITAYRAVEIADHVSIGPYCIIADAEAPPAVLDGAASPPEPRPITIGEGAWLAGRVTLLPGATIGPRAVITAGSIVSGTIPADVVAGGNPARVLRRLRSDEAPAGPPAAEDAPPPASRAPRGPSSLRGIVVSDFTADELARSLAGDDAAPLVDCEVAPFGQVVQTLVRLGQAGDDERPDFAVVWTRPEAVSPSFEALTLSQAADTDRILSEVDDFCALLVEASRHVRFLLVPTWVLPSYERGLGVRDMQPGVGLANTLMRMNLRLAEQLGGRTNVAVLDAQRWLVHVGKHASSAKLWYMGKVPFHPEVFAEATRDVKAALAGFAGQARKLLVLDLDDTLWGGVVGDVGWENLRLGGHDSVGEAYADFQRHLKALARRGVVLGLASKNEESVALEAIRSHPEMVLGLDDFAGWKISWKDKAQNIADLAAELNLGLQSVVFIDDNPVERARVREALPEVLVPDWPQDTLLYTTALLGLRCFDAPVISAEDRRRTAMYAEERQRSELRQSVGSVDAWLRTLGTRVSVEELTTANLPRATQLLNKTNQMNLSTRRLTEPELLAWAREPRHQLWTLSVSDRFGDAGLTGLVSLAEEGAAARVVDFVLSCRVMGRKVEETMLHLAVEHARRRGLERVVARYLPTAKNKPCGDFFRQSGFEPEPAQREPEANRDLAGQEFCWPTQRPYPLPDSVRLEAAAPA